MTNDIFGNLLNWDVVLAKLEQLESERRLDEHQVGLARILRYRNNWRLTKWVLTHVFCIEQVSDILIAEVVNLLVDDRNVPLNERVLAAKALGHLICHRPPQESGDHLRYDAERVMKILLDIRRSPGPPILQATLSESIAEIRAAQN